MQKHDSGLNEVGLSRQQFVFTRRRAVGALIGGVGVALLAACGAPAPTAPAAPPPTAAPALAPTAAPTAPPAPTATVASTAVPANPTSAVAAKPTSAPSNQPRTGGTLRANTMTDLTPIDGHFTNTGFGLSSWLTYEPLVAYDDQLKVQPVLAESWELSSDGRQVVLHLRKGAQYHNGRELNSEDILFNFTRIWDPRLSRNSYGVHSARDHVVRQ